MILLSNEDFFKKYFEIYEGINIDYFKFETIQEYFEYEIADWNSVKGSEILEVINKAQNTIYKSKDRYRSVLNRGVKLNRVRFLKFPLSKYILRQFSSYIISKEIGENIFIVEGEEIKVVPENYQHDFILLDDMHLFVHVYENGVLKGAYYSDSIADIAPYVKIKNKLLKISTPLFDFFKNYNIFFNRLLE